LDRAGHVDRAVGVREARVGRHRRVDVARVRRGPLEGRRLLVSIAATGEGDGEGEQERGDERAHLHRSGNGHREFSKNVCNFWTKAKRGRGSRQGVRRQVAGIEVMAPASTTHPPAGGPGSSQVSPGFSVDTEGAATPTETSTKRTSGSASGRSVEP